MCGIFGIKRLEEAGQLGPPILPVQIDLMLNSIEYRGNDAAGVALVSLDGSIHVFKDHEPAWNITARPDYRRWIDEHLAEDIVCVIGHTRKATKGTPFRNVNNHPLRLDGGAVVHNGMLSNDDKLFADLKLDRGAETDSDILRAILDAAGGVNKDALDEMNRVSGSVASALVHPEDPTKLMLLRSGNPLVTADDGQTFYFASDKRAIYRGARPWIERHGFTMQLQAPNLAFVTMPNDTGWIIGSEGLEWHGKFNSSTVRYRFQSYGDVYSPHGRDARRAHQAELAAKIEAKIEAKAEEAPAAEHKVVSADEFASVQFVKCPNIQCRWMMSLTDEQSKMSLTRLRCGKCKTNLTGALKSMRILAKDTAENRPSVN